MTRLRDRLVTLTPQQVRVLMMLSEGLLNKQIAYELGASEATIKGSWAGWLVERPCRTSPSANASTARVPQPGTSRLSSSASRSSIAPRRTRVSWPRASAIRAALRELPIRARVEFGSLPSRSAVTASRTTSGVSFDESILDMTFVYPLESNWQSGDYSIQCVVHPQDGQETASESFRNSRR